MTLLITRKLIVFPFQILLLAIFFIDKSSGVSNESNFKHNHNSSTVKPHEKDSSNLQNIVLNEQFEKLFTKFKHAQKTFYKKVPSEEMRELIEFYVKYISCANELKEILLYILNLAHKIDSNSINPKLIRLKNLASTRSILKMRPMKVSEIFYNIIDSNNPEISPFIELFKRHKIAAEKFTNAETLIFKALQNRSLTEKQIADINNYEFLNECNKYLLAKEALDKYIKNQDQGN